MKMPSSTVLYPRHSMYAIYAYIGVVSGVNVGKYGIHGVFGYIYIHVQVASVGSVKSSEPHGFL